MYYIWNPSICNYKNGKYLASIMDDWAIMCDEIIESHNGNGKKGICKTQNFYIYLYFFLIAIALLMAVSIYCYLIKYQSKQKHLLPFHVTNNDLK